LQNIATCKPKPRGKEPFCSKIDAFEILISIKTANQKSFPSRVQIATRHGTFLTFVYDSRGHVALLAAQCVHLDQPPAWSLMTRSVANLLFFLVIVFIAFPFAVGQWA
jgi:hypothetical protein